MNLAAVQIVFAQNRTQRLHDQVARYNNAANRAYYACFQAAVAALDRAGVRPRGAQTQWSHRFVQAEFPSLIRRRKMYPADVRATFSHLLTLREQADYKLIGVSETQAARALTRARAFVAAIAADGGRMT